MDLVSNRKMRHFMVGIDKELVKDIIQLKREIKMQKFLEHLIVLGYDVQVLREVMPHDQKEMLKYLLDLDKDLWGKKPDPLCVKNKNP